MMLLWFWTACAVVGILAVGHLVHKVVLHLHPPAEDEPPAGRLR